jgi:hypothetical protein
LRYPFCKRQIFIWRPCDDARRRHHFYSCRLNELAAPPWVGPQSLPSESKDCRCCEGHQPCLAWCCQ